MASPIFKLSLERFTQIKNSSSDLELFDFEDKICTLSTQTLFKLFGPSLPFQQVAGNAILFNAEMKFPIKANKKVGQNGQNN